MLSKLFWVGTFVCLVNVFTLGQDPTKVEPTHYKLDFENERVQVVSVNYGPHESLRCTTILAGGGEHHGSSSALHR